MSWYHVIIRYFLDLFSMPLIIFLLLSVPCVLSEENGFSKFHFYIYPQSLPELHQVRTYLWEINNFHIDCMSRSQNTWLFHRLPCFISIFSHKEMLPKRKVRWSTQWKEQSHLYCTINTSDHPKWNQRAEYSQ